jgi:hypothetical protein
MIRENLEEKLGTAELTTSNKRILNLHIPRPTLCLRVLIRIPLSSNWITLNKADDKTANTHCEQTKNRGHDCCFEPGSRAKDPNEEDTYGDFWERDAEEGPCVSKEGPESSSWNYLG